ncbi:MAG: DUF1667 domain-containing protein [Hyphomicrobiales bacterium]|nr:DUF1667 domain-containing protein [Hyphomicrobiales bacterium]MCP5371320.1 DUF1667 domain-containing protein [Hyphomicrobiales bacterium]
MNGHHVDSYLCIGCPLGCRLEVEEVHTDGVGDDIEVRGFTCKKGKEYGRQEHTDPRRVVTTTVALGGGAWDRLPVKTSAAVPKDLVRDVCRELRRVRVDAPVAMGTVVLKDVLGTGIDVVATRDL